MALIAYIEANDRTTGIDQGRWLELIENHPAFSGIPPRPGINPFTRQTCEFKAPDSTAMVLAEGSDHGTISWGEDGAPILLVEAPDSGLDGVAEIAGQVAQELGGRFVAVLA